MDQNPEAVRAVPLRMPVNLARLAVRSGRRTVRERRNRRRWWAIPLTSAGADAIGADAISADAISADAIGSSAGAIGVQLVPATIAARREWQQLITAAGERPPAEGIGASPLGGAAASEADWVQRCLDLRARARRGDAYVYLVRAAGNLVGEALAFVDGGTSAAELVVWLSPTVRTPARYADAVELLATHIFLGPQAPARAIITEPAQDDAIATALVAIGFVREGVLHDPPRSDRAVFVAHRASARDELAVAS